MGFSGTPCLLVVGVVVIKNNNSTNTKNSTYQPLLNRDT
jgi:hypothetical protein